MSAMPRPQGDRRRRLAGPVAGALGVLALVAGSVARADTPPADASPATPAGTPGADQIQFAAREHDLGYRAYVEKQYDEAASHFENAFFAAPNPVELRSAIRARRDAGELARAATLAAIALRRYPTDAATSKAATDTLSVARAHVYEVTLESTDEYSVAIDEKIVSSERVRESNLFMNAGTHELLVSWSDSRNQRVSIQATDGGTETLRLDPPALPPPPPPVPTPTPTPMAATATPPAPSLPGPPSASGAPSKPFGPAVFVTGAALTGVALGVMVWSGIDTENNPGKDAVKADCVNQGPSCQTYQTGLAHEHRTDALIGVTAGLAAATAVVGVFFTQWSPAHTTGGVQWSPRVGLGQAGVDGTF
jgi:hypothetical protein